MDYFDFLPPPPPPPQECEDPCYKAAIAILNEGEQLMYQQNEDSLREALVKFQKAESLFEEAGSRWGQGWCSLNSGIVYRHLGKLNHAESRLCRASNIFASSNEIINLGRATYELGHVASRRGEIFEALHLYEEALPSFNEENLSTRERADVHTFIGDALSGLGDWFGAADNYQKAVDTYRAMECPKDLIETLQKLSCVYEKLSLNERAKACNDEVSKTKSHS